MNVLDLVAKLSLDSSAYDSGLNSAKSLAGSIGGGIKSALGIGVKAVEAATAAVTAFAGASVNTGMDFDKAMSQVQATMLKTDDEMSKSIGHSSTAFGEFEGNLREFAQFLGKNTAFSATQAAEALNYMALAGYSTQESMDMLPNVLSLAAAGNFDLARASDMVTDAQTAFGISADRTSQMVDEMAKAASTGNTSVEQLGDAFLVVGGLAKELNGGFVTLKDGSTKSVDGLQEMEIALTAMANAGVKGSEAGTHMRNMLLKLSSPTDAGTKALEAMGVTVFDAQGKMRSLSDVFGDLSGKLDKMTQEQKIQTISELFNTRDMASAEALLAAVGQDWDEIGEAILNAEGSASQMADIQLDNLSGDITLMKSAFEGFQIAVSDKCTPALREFVQLGTQGLSDLTTIFSSFDASKYVDEMGGLTQEGILAQQEFERNRQKAIDSLFGTITDGVNLIVKQIPTMVDAGIKLIEALGKGILDNLPTIVDAAVEIVVKLGEGLTKALPALAQGAMMLVKSLGTSLLEHRDEILQTGFELLQMLIQGITEGLPQLLEGVTLFLQSFVTMIMDNKDTLMTAGFDILKTLWDGVIAGIPEMTSFVIDLMGNIGDMITQNLPTLLDTGLHALMELSGTLRENAGLMVDAALDLIMKLAEGLIDSLPVMIETIPTIVSNIAGIINDNAPKLIATGIELIGKLVMGIVKAIPTIIAEFPKIIKAIADVIMAFNWVNLGKHIITFISNGVKTLATSIPNMLKDIGAKGLNTLKNLNWKTLGSDLIKFIVNGIKGLSSSIPSLLKNIGTMALTALKNINWLGVGKNIIAGIVSGISNSASLILDAIKNVVGGAWDAVVDFFKISSPSKKMMWVGKMVDEGLAKGIEDSAKLVDNAMQDLEVTPAVDSESNAGVSSSPINVIMNIYGAVGQSISDLTDEVAERLNTATGQQLMAWR